jgi:hypothetical protein
MYGELKNEMVKKCVAIEERRRKAGQSSALKKEDCGEIMNGLPGSV